MKTYRDNAVVVRFLGAIVLLIPLLGCAAIFQGTSNDLPVTSNPSGVLVLVDGVPTGRTPLQVSLASNRDHLVTFRTDDGREQTVQVRQSLGGGWIVLDILFTGLLGIVVDAATGAWYSPEMDSLHMELPQPAYGPQPYPQQPYPQPVPGPAPQQPPPNYTAPQTNGVPGPAPAQ